MGSLRQRQICLISSNFLREHFVGQPLPYRSPHQRLHRLNCVEPAVAVIQPKVGFAKEVQGFDSLESELAARCS
jgi:hypothetical protein